MTSMRQYDIGFEAGKEIIDPERDFRVRNEFTKSEYFTHHLFTALGSPPDEVYSEFQKGFDLISEYFAINLSSLRP